MAWTSKRVIRVELLHTTLFESVAVKYEILKTIINIINAFE